MRAFILSCCFLLAVCGCAIAPSSAPAAQAESAAEANLLFADAAPAPTAMPQPKKAKNTARFAAPQGRQMAFTAQLVLSVGNVREAIAQVRSAVLAGNGHVRRMNDNSLNVAIPAEKADAILQEICRLGVVLSLQTEGEDVTQQVTDTAIRLENLQRSRQRLLALLEKAGRVEEMVQVEREITRVTTDLERLQAQQKDLQGRVQFVTLTVLFRTAVQQTTPQPDTPVAWVNSLGADLLDLNVKADLADDSDFLFDLTLPEGFIKCGKAMAVSADNCVIALQDQPNAVIAPHWYGNDCAPLAFYRPMIEKALKCRFNAAVEVQESSMDGNAAMVFTVTPVIGNVRYTYRVAVAVRKDRVKLLEVRARSDVFQKTMTSKTWSELLGSVRFSPLPFFSRCKERETKKSQRMLRILTFFSSGKRR